MSAPLLSRSPDLQRLREEGYEVEISEYNYLLIHNVPYVNERREVARGILASALDLSGEVTVQPRSHVALFAGEPPCEQNGVAMKGIGRTECVQEVAKGVRSRFQFSCKAAYPDYFAKMSQYVDILSNPAKSLDPSATAQTGKVLDSSEDPSTVFNYRDTASSRVGIAAMSEKLKSSRVAIIGLGGTGGYVLDLVAKTPVDEIHLFDGDTYYQHNAFRSPGAPSLEDLQAKHKKVDYLRSIYSKMHKGIVAHPYAVSAATLDELSNIDFVFICMDKGAEKRLIVEKLEALNRPFIDVGMGVQLVDTHLLGTVAVTTSTPRKRDHIAAKKRISFADVNNDYKSNIQIADLNALNAALAVVRWKKLRGFYHDARCEHFSTYTVSENMVLNDDSPE